jgi:hypothetical protein
VEVVVGRQDKNASEYKTMSLYLSESESIEEQKLK